MLRKRHLEAEKEEEEETQTLAKHKKILREKATADELENISPRHPSEAVDEESAVKQVLGKSPVVKRRPLVALQDNTPRVVGSESAQEDVDALIVRKLVHTTLLLQQKDRGKLFQESPKHLNFKWEVCVCVCVCVCVYMSVFTVCTVCSLCVCVHVLHRSKWKR